MLSIDLFIIHILNTRTHTHPQKKRTKQNGMEEAYESSSPSYHHTHSFKKPREKEHDDNQTPFLAREWKGL
jgi:hypothetical protein